MTMKTFVFTLLMMSSLLSAQPQAGAGSIEGIVVRFGSDDPIAGVNVEMRRVEGTPDSPLLPPVYFNGRFSPGATVIPNSPNPADAFYATTGNDGAFRFAALKPGKYRLLAAHPDGIYYPAEYGQRNPRGPGYDFSLDSALSMKVRIEMAPMASVSGLVTGADGKPAAHVHVMAAEIAYQNGIRVLNQIQGVESDERGNYRLFWLPPGKYYIGAFPEGIRRRQITVPFGPPAAVESMNQFISQAFIHYRTGSDGEILRDVYDIVYSPGQTSPDAANVIDLRLGSNVNGIDISLAPGRKRAVRIRGVVLDSNGQPVKNASVQAVPQVTGPVTISPTATADSNGAFEIDGVMQGKYLVTTEFMINNAIQTAVQYLTVEASDIANVNLVATAGLRLSGHITIDGADTDAYRVLLSSENIVTTSHSSGNVPGSVFSIPGIMPGNYRINVAPISGREEPALFVKSIRFDGVESVNGVLQIGNSSSGQLDILLGRNGAIAEGRVLDNQRQPSANVMVVLVPADSKRPDLFKTATTDVAGHFQIQGVAPGSYLAFAWTWLPNGIWRYPEFYRTIEGRGTRITISEGASNSIDLTLLPEVNF
jgi:protocatechuate 3,4-dioxygenase beta subunit